MIKDIIAKYKGNYVKEMRKEVGHAPLMVIGCGVIIENSKGEILLQKRRDNGCWAILGGSMEVGEKFTEAVRREVYEEAGIELGELELFGIYSGEDRVIQYPNGDICFGAGVVFKATQYTGELLNNTEETIEHKYFSKENMPDNINKFDMKFIDDWLQNSKSVIID